MVRELAQAILGTSETREDSASSCFLATRGFAAAKKRIINKLLAVLILLLALCSDIPAASRRCYSGARNSKGRIARSSSARYQFRKAHPCPSTGKTTGPCRGYVIDHRKALKRGGADHSSNMQWQTKEAARAKDRWE